MTRTEIHDRVFNRNIAADALSGGLRILHELERRLSDGLLSVALRI
jgi:hypothetical protein